jgi:sugar phosphate isomerase/epimerase
MDDVRPSLHLGDEWRLERCLLRRAPFIHCNAWGLAMMDRREFMTAMGAVGLTGTGFLSTARTAGASRRLDRIGVQLYTVRSAMQESVERTLERVAAIGYAEVEFAGYFDRSPQQIRHALDATGLSAPAVHLPLEQLEHDWEGTVAAAATVGHHYLVVAWIPPADRGSLDTYRSFAERFNRLGERAKAAGLTFGYHNHDFEFEPQGGQLPYDLLVDETDPALVTFELDLFWITKAGHDPGTYFREHPGRFPLVHVKDMSGDGSMVDVGAGTIDFASLFALSDEAGIHHHFVEHDNPTDPFESIAASYRHLRDLEF